MNSFEPLPFSFVSLGSPVYIDGAERRTLGGVIHKNYNLIVHFLMLAYGFRWFYGAIHFLKGNPDALTKEDVQKLNEASRINAEKDEAYWNGYWDGFVS